MILQFSRALNDRPCSRVHIRNFRNETLRKLIHCELFISTAYFRCLFALIWNFFSKQETWPGEENDACLVRLNSLKSSGLIWGGNYWAGISGGHHMDGHKLCDTMELRKSPQQIAFVYSNRASELETLSSNWLTKKRFRRSSFKIRLTNFVILVGSLRSTHSTRPNSWLMGIKKLP